MHFKRGEDSCSCNTFTQARARKYWRVAASSQIASKLTNAEYSVFFLLLYLIYLWWDAIALLYNHGCCNLCKLYWITESQAWQFSWLLFLLSFSLCFTVQLHIMPHSCPPKFWCLPPIGFCCNTLLPPLCPPKSVAPLIKSLLIYRVFLCLCAKHYYKIIRARNLKYREIRYGSILF